MTRVSLIDVFHGLLPASLHCPRKHHVIQDTQVPRSLHSLPVRSGPSRLPTHSPPLIKQLRTLHETNPPIYGPLKTGGWPILTFERRTALRRRNRP
ncbi:hypothetical protein PM082_010189 [Marasmius tenuissimus]|nr:hypothetical protein PM082_010189 [Marasmius tenuissimus]